MRLTDMQTLIMIFATAAGTAITRYLPFLLFPEKKKPNKYITYLGTYLPAAMMGLLVVYCLKDIFPLTFPHGIPEASAIAVTVLLHVWKSNALLSICGGTAMYMLLVQGVFN